MESVEEYLKKVREERKAREKARIEKLRELNLKKYNNNQPTLRNTNKHVEMKPVRNISSMRNNDLIGIKHKQEHQEYKKGCLIPKIQSSSATSKLPANMNIKKSIRSDTNILKQNGSIPSTSKENLTSKKSILPGPIQNNNRQSVFERLYKPKPQVRIQSDNVKTLSMDSKCLKINKKSTNELPKRRCTTFDTKSKDNPRIRRSISAVHFKRINKSELSNCIHKYASIGNKIDSAHLKNLNEDETINQDIVVSAVKSERKKVKFMTPMAQNYNTPRPDEMQMKLKSWLQKRGISFDSYQHLQCFGINHMAEKIRHFDLEGLQKIELSNEENKENIAVDSASDDGSYMDNIYGENRNKDFDVWRKASLGSESCELNETVNTTLTSVDTPNRQKDILHGALNDLTGILKEGYEWEQCARWLRAIRERFPAAIDTAPYWECRAALEEHRGDLSASVECWEQAIAKGTERSVVEANLDQLLDKFMQLKISPNSTERNRIDPKLVDIKNVFKSTIIRFAVKQGKLRQSDQNLVKYTATPVRRSGRLSSQIKRTPFSECPTFKKFPQEAATFKQLKETLGQDLNFVPNTTLHGTP